MTQPAHSRNAWRGGWYVVPYQVLFRDLDSFGHVNNAVFFTYFEFGRTQLWFEITGAQDAGDIAFIVARAECDFKKQIGMEPVEIWTRVGDMRTTSFDFLSEIRKSNGEQVAAVGKVVVVMFDWKTGSKVAISDDFRRRLMELQKSES
ncbi:MAG TPA: acyl-CoA thioesterase [Thermoanaerobaculia bacterium]|nr:acyl-CoA thioesterase [Thermoanaerobaculia bacterium]